VASDTTGGGGGGGGHAAAGTAGSGTGNVGAAGALVGVRTLYRDLVKRIGGSGGSGGGYGTSATGGGGGGAGGTVWLEGYEVQIPSGASVLATGMFGLIGTQELLVRIM
jgi:hypothetical protein